MTGGEELKFYYRNGCQLCEELAAVLLRGWPDVAATVHWVDIDGAPHLSERYGLRLPVLERGGELICELEPDLVQLTRSFGNPRLPV